MHSITLVCQFQIRPCPPGGTDPRTLNTCQSHGSGHSLSGCLLSCLIRSPPSLRTLHLLPTLGFTQRLLCHVVACHFPDGEPLQWPLQNQHVYWHQHQSPNLQQTVRPRCIRCPRTASQIPSKALHLSPVTMCRACHSSAHLLHRILNVSPILWHIMSSCHQMSFSKCLVFVQRDRQLLLLHLFFWSSPNLDTVFDLSSSALAPSTSRVADRPRTRTHLPWTDDA